MLLYENNPHWGGVIPTSKRVHEHVILLFILTLSLANVREKSYKLRPRVERSVIPN